MEHKGESVSFGVRLHILTLPFPSLVTNLFFGP